LEFTVQKSNRLPAGADVPHESTSAWSRFWLQPVPVTGLHILRIVAGFMFIAWLLPFAGNVEDLFSMQGWVDRQALLEISRAPEDATIPIGWSLLYLCQDNGLLVHVMYWAAIAIFTLFTLGLWTRITGVLTWVMVISFLASPAAYYEADILLGIIAFYLMIGYLLLGLWDRDLSPAERVLGPGDTSIFAAIFRPTRETPLLSRAANVALRLIQVHFAIIITTSAFHKLQFGRWWAGLAFWFPLHPPYETTAKIIRDETANASFLLFVLSLAQYLVLAWQLGFPLFAWRRRWRPLLLGGAVVGWLGSFFLYRSPVFGPVYFVGCLSFLSSQEWAWIADMGRRGRQRLPGHVPTQQKRGALSVER
jgi:hypothetical protein